MADPASGEPHDSFSVRNLHSQELTPAEQYQVYKIPNDHPPEQKFPQRFITGSFFLLSAGDAAGEFAF
jgi:hypothetical protein